MKIQPLPCTKHNIDDLDYCAKCFPTTLLPKGWEKKRRKEELAIRMSSYLKAAIT